MKHLMRALTATVLAALLSWSAPAVRAAEPIKIGFSMELTGPFARTEPPTATRLPVSSSMPVYHAEIP